MRATTGLVAAAVITLFSTAAPAQYDWPRWRGPPPRAVNPPWAYPGGDRRWYDDGRYINRGPEFPRNIPGDADLGIEWEPRYPRPLPPMVPRGAYPYGGW